MRKLYRKNLYQQNSSNLTANWQENYRKDKKEITTNKNETSI